MFGYNIWLQGARTTKKANPNRDIQIYLMQMEWPCRWSGDSTSTFLVITSLVDPFAAVLR